MKLGRVRLGFIAAVAGILIGFLVLPNVLYSTWLRSRNLIWHWRHHDRVRIQSYEVYIPSQWFVSHFGDSLMLTDLTTSRGQIAVITIAKSNRPLDIEQQKKFEKLLSERLHSTPVLWTKLPIGNGKMFCHELNIAEIRQLSFVGKECHVNTLDITFSGTKSQLATFDEFLKGITPIR